MKQTSKSRFNKCALALVVGCALATLGSTASASIVDGVLSPGDNYQHTTALNFQLDNGTMVKDSGTLAWSVDTSGNVFVLFIQPLSINDNTYGTNSIGWNTGTGGKKGGGGGGGHTFGNLTGSDKAHFDFTNGAGASVLSFNLDYLSSSSGAKSGFASLGVNGGDGGITSATSTGGGKKGGGGGGTGIGNAADILAWGTSLDYNLNSTAGHGASNAPGLGHSTFTTNSPATTPARNPDGSIDYSKPYANPADASGWVYYISYEVEVSAAAFGPSGFGTVVVPYAHDSPSKFGENTIIVVPEPSTYLGGLALIAFLIAAHARAVLKKKEGRVS